MDSETARRTGHKDSTGEPRISPTTYCYNHRILRSFTSIFVRKKSSSVVDTFSHSTQGSKGSERSRKHKWSCLVLRTPCPLVSKHQKSTTPTVHFPYCVNYTPFPPAPSNSFIDDDGKSTMSSLQILLRQDKVPVASPHHTRWVGPLSQLTPLAVATRASPKVL